MYEHDVKKATLVKLKKVTASVREDGGTGTGTMSGQRKKRRSEA